MQHHLKSIHENSIVLSRFKVKLINFSMIILHFLIQTLTTNIQMHEEYQNDATSLHLYIDNITYF